MNRFDTPHNNDRSDQQLSDALHDVQVPTGLQERLLDAVLHESKVEPTSARDDSISQPERRYSRRRWLTGGIAAGVSGLLGAGYFSWQLRPLLAPEILANIAASLSQRDWTKWQQAPPPRPFPTALSLWSGWQRRSINIDEGSVAFNVTQLGLPAVLFVIETERQCEHLPTINKAQIHTLSGNQWSHSCLWRDSNPSYLRVLAIQGEKNDFHRFFHSRPSANLA